MRGRHDGPTLTIANGDQFSDELDESQLTGIDQIAFAAPGTLPETVTIGVSLDGGANFRTLQSGGQDITIPAGKCVVINAAGFDALRLEADSAVTGDRDFFTNFVEDIT